MKFLHLTIVFILSFFIETPNESITILYKAQTRGFIYQLELKDTHLKINNKEIVLSEKHYKEVKKTLSNINFDKLSSNILQKELAVDKAIEGVLNVSFKNKKYQFHFNHNNLPKKICNLKELLESFLE